MKRVNGVSPVTDSMEMSRYARLPGRKVSIVIHLRMKDLTDKRTALYCQ